MAGDGQRAKSPEIPAILESYQTEGNDHKQDCFFVDVPAKEEGCVTAERHSTDKSFPGGLVEETEKDRLGSIS